MEALLDIELAPILAGLRLLQQEVHRDGKKTVSLRYEHFTEDLTVLGVDELDDLCERLNTAANVILQHPEDIREWAMLQHNE